ncbi:MAG: hypothetical protein EAZ27_01350 [Cytophagales bacterium]|nr:MAG: hypothetical protein EAZ27_01350 [Cytophagales bacterium]
MNTLSNFSDFALTRGEMKNVSGGATCHAKVEGGGSVTITGKGSFATFAQAAKWQAGQPGYGGNWCCESCSSTSWCVNC